MSMTRSVGNDFDRTVRSLRGAEIAGKSYNLTTGCGLHFADRLVDAGLCATGDNDARTFPGQACGDGKPDTRSAAGNKRASTFEVEVHAFGFSWRHPLYTAQQAHPGTKKATLQKSNGLATRQFHFVRSN
jgi:hypothetical protein